MLPALIIAVHVLMNVFACRAVLRGGNTPRQQMMIIAAIWCIPVIGLLMAYGFTAPPVPGAMRPPSPLAGIDNEEAPLELRIIGMGPFDVTPHLGRHVHSGAGFPLLNWTALAQWADTAGSEEGAERAFEAGVRAWLLHMRDACGTSFRLYETDDAYVLSPLDNRALLVTAAYIATTRKRIGQVLAGVADFGMSRKSILLVLNDEDAYYDYLSPYYPDGEFAASGGIFINAGCPHFVVPLADLSAIEPVIAHEMTHSALSHLALPRWLDEGLAVNTEQRLTRAPALEHSPQELRAKHLDYWGASEVQQFWSGDSFFRPDDGNLLSYELARILVAHMSGDWESFKGFVRHADAGAQAAREQLNVELGALVCALLEQPYCPDWEPEPGVWETDGKRATT